MLSRYLRSIALWSDTGFAPAAAVGEPDEPPEEEALRLSGAEAGAEVGPGETVEAGRPLPVDVKLEEEPGRAVADAVAGNVWLFSMCDRTKDGMAPVA